MKKLIRKYPVLLLVEQVAWQIWQKKFFGSYIFVDLYVSKNEINLFGELFFCGDRWKCVDCI